MEKLHLTLLKTANWLSASMLVLLGFSCSNENEGDGPLVCEYGTPYAQYQLKGKVQDTKGNPVPDIQIRVYSRKAHDYWMSSDTIYSGADGQYKWETTDFPSSEYTLITEESGIENNIQRFTSDTTTLIYKKEDFVGGERWFAGTATKEMNITLKEYVDTHTEPYTLYTIYGRITDESGYPIPGILVLTNPAYTANKEKDPASFPAITDMNGRYRFTYDRAAAVKHTIYTEIFTGYWNYPDACSQDSTVVDFSEIELSGGKGMLIGKGSKEVNFQLKRKY